MSQVGGKVHPVAEVRLAQATRTFFCDHMNQLCSPLDVSFPEHAYAASTDNRSYVWEYVETCTAKTQPCVLQHSRSIFLRQCPAGTVLINSTQSGIFGNINRIFYEHARFVYFVFGKARGGARRPYPHFCSCIHQLRRHLL